MPDEDLKTIWQSQPTEASEMTLTLIRQRARELHAKTRRELLGGIASVLIVLAISVTGIIWTSDPTLRCVFAIAIFWALAGQFFLHRGMWSETLPGDAALSTGFEFYRREVERRRNLFGRVLQWSFGPVVLSIVTLILVLAAVAKNRSLSVGALMPFCTLFALWMVAVIVLRSRGQRALQREINELNNIQK